MIGFLLIDAGLALLVGLLLTRFLARKRSQRRFHLKLITILTSTAGARDLLERVSSEIQQATNTKHASLFVYKPDGHYITAGTTPHKITAADCVILERYMSRTKNTEVFTRNLDDETEVRRLLKSYRVEFALALMRGHQVTGFLFIGPASKGELKKYQIRTISEIRHELAIAVQNAVSLETIKELNSNLQQKVTAATGELQHSNEQLRDLDKAKDEFVSMASHQLRTPLTSVKGYISMVLEGDAGKISKDQRKLLSEAFTSSERMVHLINDFLNVSRIQTGKFLIERHDIDLVKIVEQEVSSLQTTAESRGLTFKVVVPPKPVILSLDENKIRQVIMNFIDNALFYSRPETEIIIHLSVTPRDVKLEVRDQGIGVPLSQQTRLFTKFFRADNARLQRPDGTGVGLFLTKKVIDGHGGKLVFSSVEGKGSTFGFKLPIK